MAVAVIDFLIVAVASVIEPVMVEFTVNVPDTFFKTKKPVDVLKLKTTPVAPVLLVTVSSAINVPVLCVITKFVLNFNVGGVGAFSCSAPASIIFNSLTRPISEPKAFNVAFNPVVVDIETVGNLV